LTSVFKYSRFVQKNVVLIGVIQYPLNVSVIFSLQLGRVYRDLRTANKEALSKYHWKRYFTAESFT